MFVSFGVMHGLKLIHCALFLRGSQREPRRLLPGNLNCQFYSVSQLHVHLRKGVFLAYWGCRRWPVTVAGVLCQLVSKRDGSFMPFVRAGWWVALPWALGEEIIIGLRVNVYPLPWRSVRYMYLRIKLQNYIL